VRLLTEVFSPVHGTQFEDPEAGAADAGGTTLNSGRNFRLGSCARGDGTALEERSGSDNALGLRLRVGGGRSRGEGEEGHGAGQDGVGHDGDFCAINTAINRIDGIQEMNACVLDEEEKTKSRRAEVVKSGIADERITTTGDKAGLALSLIRFGVTGTAPLQTATGLAKANLEPRASDVMHPPGLHRQEKAQGCRPKRGEGLVWSGQVRSNDQASLPNEIAPSPHAAGRPETSVVARHPFSLTVFRLSCRAFR
jgi:hypothetical protein